MWENDLMGSMRKVQMRLDRVFTNIGDGIRRAWTDLDEKDNEYILNVELPGVEKEDISLDIVDGRLEIRAEKKREIEKEEDGEYRYAKSYKGFARSLDLPEDADVEEIDVQYKNGVLRIKIRKREGSAIKKKRIEVK